MSTSEAWFGASSYLAGKLYSVTHAGVLSSPRQKVSLCYTPR